MFLFDYKSRLHRILVHLVFWLTYVLFFSVMSINPWLNLRQNLISGFIFVPVDIMATYLTMYWLLPAFLIRKRYISFILLFILMAFSTILLNQAIQYYIYIPIFYPEKTGLKVFWQGNYWYYLVTTNMVVVIGAGVKLTKMWVREQQDKTLLENEKMRSELAMLKSQINPHFLFNTLNNIDSLIESRPKEASMGIIRLSDILRYVTYNTGNDFVTIENEEECLRSYIELNTLRFGKQFVSYESHIRDSSRMIAPMLLIPLAENAVKHGDKQQRLPSVTIRLVVEDSIEFVVENAITGESTHKDLTGGVGLNNLRRRLELIYPGSHRFECSIQDNTYKAYLWIQ